MERAFKLEITTDYDNKYVNWIELEALIIEGTSETLIDRSSSSYTPSKGDKLYLLKGVSIPRVKLKDLNSNFGIKVTRSLDNATHAFIGNSTENKMRENVWMYSMHRDLVQQFYDILVQEGKCDDCYLNRLKEAISINTHDYFYMDYSTAGCFRNHISECFSKLRENEELKEKLRNSNYYSVINEDNYDLISELEKLNIEILDESELLVHINGDDATVIDGDVFDQISKMFDSSDDDNKILAMEIMANCNYTDSLLYLEMLFKEYSYYMEKNRTKNHVNFKGLLAFLGKNKSYMSTNIDDIVRSLKENNVLTVEALNVLMDKYYEEIKSRGDTTYFKVKDICLSPEVMEELDMPYNYKLIDDYVKQEELVEKPDPDFTISHNSLVGMGDLDANETETEEITENNLSEASAEETKTDENGGGFDWF
jgi:hypothetical protein